MLGPLMSGPLMFAGVEREWRVVRRNGAAVDFRELVDRLPLDGRRLDPDDPHAHRCRWGGVVTADGREAEVATPPVPVAGRSKKPCPAPCAEEKNGFKSVLPAL